MYVLIHKNRVVTGPIGWNRAIFDGNLTKLGITGLIPRSVPDQLPLAIDADTKIAQADFNYPQYNQKIEYLEGPYWDLTADVAVANYEVREQPIDSVKYNLKQVIADERWKKEIAGTKTTIQGVEVTVDTDRATRDIFVSKYLLMGDQDTVGWKFPEAWLTLTKPELGQVVAAGAAHIEGAFAWEAAKSAEIDASTTLAQLDAIELRIDPPAEEQPAA